MTSIASWKFDELEGDGLCIIDVLLKVGASSEVANWALLHQAATNLFRGCAQQSREGGIATNLGKLSLFPITCRSIAG